MCLQKVNSRYNFLPSPLQILMLGSKDLDKRLQHNSLKALTFFNLRQKVKENRKSPRLILESKEKILGIVSTFRSTYIYIWLQNLHFLLLERNCISDGPRTEDGLYKIVDYLCKQKLIHLIIRIQHRRYLLAIAPTVATVVQVENSI